MAQEIFDDINDVVALQPTPEPNEPTTPEQPLEETVQETQEEVPQAHASQETSDAEINFRAMRQLKEKAERERDELVARLSSQEKYKQAPVQEELEEELSLSPDDLVEGKHLSTIQKNFQRLEQKVRQYEKVLQEQTVEARVKAEMPDYFDVVSNENIDIFKTAYPELAASAGASPDLYIKAKSTYLLIKKLGIHNTKQYGPQTNKVQSNLSKPMPASAAGAQRSKSPLEQANLFADGLTPELKKKLWQEVVDSSKNM